MNIFGPQGGNIDLQSWLFEGETLPEKQDFHKGAKEDYSVFIGPGSSPHAITSDDIPGWSEKDSADWYADLNLDDCFQIDLKNNAWRDNLSGEDAKWASTVLGEYQKFMLKNEVQEAENETEYNSFDASKDDFTQATEVFHSLPSSPESWEGTIDNMYCDRGQSSDEIEANYHEFPSKPEDRGQSSDEIETTHQEFPSKPEIIKVPISEAIIHPQIKVLDVETKSLPATSKIIFCKRITMPSPKSVRSSPPLKDIITEKGDELLEDFVKLEEPIANSHFDDRDNLQEIPSPEYDYCEVKNVSRKRRVPFSQAERKQRKKEQNKRAAIRYREKKKEEQDQMFGSIDEEEDKNLSLREENVRLVSEKEIVKRLFLDLLQRKREEVLGL